MALTTAAQSRSSFDLKSASLPVVAVLLKTTDAAQFIADLAERVAERFGNRQRHPIGAPDGANDVLHDEGEPEGQQQRIERITLVQAANEQDLDHQTQHTGKQRRNHQSTPEPQARLQRVSEISRQRHEGTLGEVDGVVEAQDERQPQRQQRIERARDEAVESVEDQNEIQGDASAAADGRRSGPPGRRTRRPARNRPQARGNTQPVCDGGSAIFSPGTISETSNRLGYLPVWITCPGNMPSMS